jgi:esterase/lipase
MMADDTAAIIEQLGLGAVDVVGHSDGANLALILARDHPKMVRRLVISGANIRADLSPEEKQRAQWSPQQLVGHLRELANRLPPWFLADYSKVSPDGPEHWMTLLAKSYEMWLQPIVIEPVDLKKISIPVLVMAGDHDFTSVEETAEIFRDLPNGQLIIVPASNHGTFNKRPELVDLAIREFLDQHDSSARIALARCQSLDATFLDGAHRRIGRARQCSPKEKFAISKPGTGRPRQPAMGRIAATGHFATFEFRSGSKKAAVRRSGWATLATDARPKPNAR